MSVNNLPAQCRRTGFNSWVSKISWRRKWQPTLVFLPGKYQGQRRLAGYSSWDHERDFEKTLGDSEGQGSLMCHNPWLQRVECD